MALPSDLKCIDTVAMADSVVGAAVSLNFRGSDFRLIWVWVKNTG